MPDWGALLAIIVGALLFVVPLSHIGFLGMDWLVYFTSEPFGSVVQRFIPVYPPWVMPYILRPLTSLPPYTGLAILNAITLSTLTVLTFRYARYAYPRSRRTAISGVLFVILTPLPWMVFWLGQVDAMTLLGLVTLPFGMPLLLAKLNIGIWAALNSRRDILWAAALGIGSLIIWGFWPLTSLQATTPADPGNPHPILMGWQTTGIIYALLGVLMLLFTNRDPLRLIAAGTFISPYIMPYHYVVLLPALGRVSFRKQLVLWAFSFLFILPIGISTLETKVIAMLFPLLVWLLTAPDLRPSALLADPDTILNRSLKTVRQIWDRFFSRS